MQLLRGEVGERDAQGTKGSVEEAHKGIVDVLGINLPTLELKGAIVAGQVARQTDQHLPERRVDIEVELAFEVVRSEFPKMSFIPCDNVGDANFPHAREEGEEGEDDGRDEELVVVEGREEGVGLGWEEKDMSVRVWRGVDLMEKMEDVRTFCLDFSARSSGTAVEAWLPLG
jgi:hypothetical protein